MAPIKLEDHIREQFEEREIAPSASAWDKLESKLDAAQGKKRPLFIWYAIAASIVGVLFIATQFFGDDTTKENQELVNTETEQLLKEEKSTSEILKNETQLVQEKIAPPINTDTPVKKDAINTERKRTKINLKPVTKLPESKLKTIDKNRIAVQEKEQVQTQKISEGIKTDLIVNTKVDEVVAAVAQIKRNRNEVTVEEIDALLLNAQRELATERMLNETKIDATALLNDVEFELEKSFRDKVFDALGDSFSKIRTAVVERNN